MRQLSLLKNNKVAKAALVIKKYLNCREDIILKFSTEVKQKLFSLIDEMDSYHWLFTRTPETDFSRKKKWTFGEVIKFIVSMEGKSLKDELLEYFEYDNHTPSNSSFNQRRAQILPEAFEFLFREFTNAFRKEDAVYKGFRLIACDGSDIRIPYNPKDETTYIQTSSDARGYNVLHLNAFYDLCNRTYIDAEIQSSRQKNEDSAMCNMIDRYKGGNAIFIADRNYESYNIFAHVMQKGLYYLIRVKDINSTGILKSIILPSDNEFDICKKLILTRKHTNEIKQQKDKYKFIPSRSTFDFLDTGTNIFFELNMRIVRFPISEDNYECIITNLPQELFNSNEIKQLYAKRWGIETSFRELKYAIGMTRFHSMKTDYIKQEIWARLTLYNFCEIITNSVVVEKKEGRKHTYQLNYTRAIRICCYFIAIKKEKAPPDVEYLIGHELLPVRTGRTDPRKVKSQSAISFLYRTA